MTTLSAAVRNTRRALGLNIPSVAKAANIDSSVLLRYEAGEQDLPGDAIWRLSDVLGVAFEDLGPADHGSLQRQIESIAVRFKTDTRGIGERDRFAVARASAAARCYVELEELANRTPRYDKLLSAFPKAAPLSKTKVPWRDGRDLALALRQRLGLPTPVPSMMKLVERLDVLILWQELSTDIAGYAFCDATHGPTIVVNVLGRNVNELVRRFTLAHELCHVLFDRDAFETISAFDRYDDLYSYADSSRDPRESRSNGFAIHLLAPPEETERFWRTSGRGRDVMIHFGISLQAAKHHLDNYALFRLSEWPSEVNTSATDEWKTSESHELWYPAFDVIPIERRHALAQLAFRLWREGTITESRLREVLRLPFDHNKILELSELYDDSVVA